MSLIKGIQQNLTEPNKELGRQIRITFPGMAHFAGSGPRDVTCRECIYWDHWKGDYYGPNNKSTPNMLKPSRCKKYAQLMRGQRGNPVPHDAAACKCFEFNKAAPSTRNGGR